MGIGSNLMVELAEERDKKEKSEWIQAQLDDLDADEFTDGWNELSEQYDTYNVSDDEQDFFDFEIWKVKGKTKVELFNEQIKASKEVLNSKFSSITSKNILVMLQGHVVASVEAYLSSTFIDLTLSSDYFLRKLVENDPELAKSKFSLIGKYLQSLIFHKIDKVNLLYDSVLDINFGNVKWLYEAVELRHHCVHRAGYDRDGYEVTITGNDIEQLILKCCKLVHTIESQIIKLPDSTDSF
jgi:hypothetical protein